jgi:hypothetical protein
VTALDRLLHFRARRPAGLLAWPSRTTTARYCDLIILAATGVEWSARRVGVAAAREINKMPTAWRADWDARRIGGAAVREINKIPAVRRAGRDARCVGGATAGEIPAARLPTEESELRAAGVRGRAGAGT